MAPRPLHATLVLVRRGPVDPTWDQSALGQADPPLQPGSEALEEGVCRALAAMRPLRVVSSDLARARSTAERLASDQDLELITRRDLRPQRMGIWQGKPWAAVLNDDQEAALAYLNDCTQVAPPRGETMIRMQERVRRGLLAEARRAAREVTVYIGHAGPIRAIAAHLLELDLTAVQRWQLDPFGISVLRIEGMHSTLVRWNDPQSQ